MIKRERLIEIMNDQYDGDSETFNAEVVADLILDEIEKIEAPDKAVTREGLERALIDQLVLQGFSLCPHGVEMNLERADDKTCWVDTQAIAEALAPPPSPPGPRRAGRGSEKRLIIIFMIDRRNFLI